jgi:hypothetical protein
MLIDPLLLILKLLRVVIVESFVNTRATATLLFLEETIRTVFEVAHYTLPLTVFLIFYLLQ